MEKVDLSKFEAVNAAIWAIWSKAVAEKWSNNQTVIAAVEKDPKAYILSHAEGKLDLSDINIKVADTMGSDCVQEQDGSWTLTLPWPSKIPEEIHHYSTLMVADAAPSGGGATSAHNLTAAAACCCSSVLCCCCC